MAHTGSPFGSPIGSPPVHAGSPTRTVFGPFPDIVGSPGVGGFNYGEAFGSPPGRTLNMIRNPDQGGLLSGHVVTTSAVVIFSKPRTIGYPSF